MKFKTQVCTSREQSQKLLGIGLRKDTADMVYQPHYTKCGSLKNYYEPKVLKGAMRKFVINNDEDFKEYIPSWSMSRLLDIYLPIGCRDMWSISDVTFDKLVDRICEASKQGDLPQEYLKYEEKEV